MGTLGYREKATHSLRFAFISSLILMVDSAEIRYDDRNRQGNDKHCNRYNGLVGNRIMLGVLLCVNKKCCE